MTSAESPTKLYNLPDGSECKDVWAVVKPNFQLPSATAEENGYTTDATANAYAQKLTEPKLYGRPHRALFASTQLPSNVDGGGVHTQVNKPFEEHPDDPFLSGHSRVLVQFRMPCETPKKTKPSPSHPNAPGDVDSHDGMGWDGMTGVRGGGRGGEGVSNP